jgi:uncharacterized protein (TIGR00730 family)
VKVCIFCSSGDVAERYATCARHFAEGLAERGHSLVWGGSNIGLMEVVASAVQGGGGQIVGVALELWQDANRQDADEMLIVKTLGERKAAMLERSDVLVILVGGLGTLDELTEVIELRRQEVHNKPIIVLNTGGFYDGLREQFRRMHDEGFLPVAVERYVTFVETPEAALEQLENLERAVI